MKKSSIYLFIIIVMGAILRLWQLGARPFDGDEGIVIKVATNNWSELIRQASSDVHPPLINILIKPIIDSWGISEWTMRLLPALLGIIFIYLVYIFAKKLLQNQIITLIAATLTAISSYLIYPSQEIRMYMLFAVLSLASFYFYYIIIQLVLEEKPVAKKYWLTYTLFSTLMIYSQYLGFIILISQLVYPIFLGFRSKFIYCYANRLKWFWSWLIMAILFLPQIKTMLAQFTARVSEQSQTLSLIDNIKGLLGAFYRFGSGRLFLDLNPSTLLEMSKENPWLLVGFLITLIVPLTLLIMGLQLTKRKYPQQFWFLLFPIIIAILLALLSTEVGSRANRYLIYIFPFYLLFVSLAALEFWKKIWGKILVITFIVINLISLYHHYVWENKAPGVNKIAEFVSQNYQDSNSVVLIRGGFGGGEEWVFKYYSNKFKIEDMLGSYQAGNLAELKAVKPQDKIKELLNQYDQVFFYDMTYSNYQIEGEKHYLGKDKENKDLVVWEITK